MKKFKIDLNFPIKDIVSGKIINTASKLLANILQMAVLKDDSKITKFFGWSLELVKLGVLELDEADHKDLKRFITDHEGIYVVAKYPILNAFSQPPAPGTGEKK